MPSVETTTDFYRNGVMGVEYLGMIRKMASINFYVRGLNPGNILQGDSLARFKKDFDPESKTAILANPPFGAERDQEAYPDVWAEYGQGKTRGKAASSQVQCSDYPELRGNCHPSRRRASQIRLLFPPFNV